MTGADGLRRSLVTVAVRYPDEDETFEVGIKDQVAAIVEWLTDPALGDRRFRARQLRPNDNEAIKDFVSRERLHQLTVRDVLVVYLTGHGVKGERCHYLELPGTRRDDLRGTAFRTADLVSDLLIKTQAEHIVVFVDMCDSGALRFDLEGDMQDTLPARRRMDTLGVMTAGDHHEKPRLGDFTETLRAALDRLRTTREIAQPEISFHQLQERMAAVVASRPDKPQPMFVWPLWRVGGPSPCLPNPGFAPPEDVVAPARRQVAVPGADLNHWIDQASGRLNADELGWYFSGRQDLMARMAGFLRDGDGVLVVTGASGTGKSAILALVVTLSDPVFLGNGRYRSFIRAFPPRALPPPLSVHAAVVARNRDTDQVAADLFTALTGGAPPEGIRPRESLRHHLLGSADCVCTLVVDGVDESREPARLITDLLGPLARLRTPTGASAVRLLLGLRTFGSDERETTVGPRTDLLALLRRNAFIGQIQQVRTDTAAEVKADITRYVEAVLVAAGPYADDAPAAREAAEVIAGRVSPSFLDARFAVQRIRRASQRCDLSDELWLASLTEGTVTLLREDLRAVADDLALPVRWLLAVLRATAFDVGRGVPRIDVWPTMAAAILDRTWPDQWSEADNVIQAVLGSRLAGYLIRDVDEDSRVVYRPSHDRLAQVLVNDPDLLVAEERP